MWSRPSPRLLRPFRALQGREHHGLAHHILCITGDRRPGILIHEASDQFRIQAAPVDADAYRPVVAAGDLYHGGELCVALLAPPHVSGVDPILRQGFGAFGIVGQQPVPVEVEVTDKGDIQALLLEAITNGRNGTSRRFVVDGDTHQLGAGLRQLSDLSRSGRNVGCVRIGHGLNHDGGVAPDRNTAHEHGNGPVAGNRDKAHEQRLRGDRRKSDACAPDWLERRWKAISVRATANAIPG